MQIFRHIGDPGLQLQESVVTLGNFDGIHLGHQALIGGAVAEAKELGIPSVVLTFEPHPLKVLTPERAPNVLLTHKDKMQLLQDLGVDIVVVQHFDLPFAKLGAEEFVRGFLADRLKAKRLWVGKDLRFGQGRSGRVENLIQWGGALGFSVAVVEPILLNGVRVSSSRVRQALSEGHVDEVVPMLGRYHFISGRVIAGHHRGRELGFPTANIATRAETLPLDGIYATLFRLGRRSLRSVSSIGVNPTFGQGPRTVESFILNFDANIYGESARLCFVKLLREERKFSSVDELIVQIRRDVECAESVFTELKIDL
ncbi:MAG TPA: bifunctional riboflavin kinase/FAD synthetase [Candidatus Binatia bacterium]|jgi:riboflavin kinase/FMN adenylyltransferase